MLKNNDESNASRMTIEEGFYVLRFQNDTDEVTREVREINSSFIQFHFCLKGQGDFLFNAGNYVFNVKEEHSILLYNPQRDLPKYVFAINIKYCLTLNVVRSNVEPSFNIRC